MYMDKKKIVAGITAVCACIAIACLLTLNGCVPKDEPMGSGSAPVAVAASVGKTEAGKEEKAVEEEAEASEEEAQTATDKEDETTAAKATDSGTSKSDSTAKSASSNTGTSKSPSSNSGSSKPAGSGSASSSKPSHTHSWQPVYRTEPVYEQKWVSKIDQKWIPGVPTYTCSGCGAVFYSVDAVCDHIWSLYDQGDPSHASYINGAEGGHWEEVDNGSYQQVQTGTKQVLDHYECSCGARK